MLIHDNAMAMTPANHLGALIETEMDLPLVHTCLGRVGDPRTDAAKARIDEVGIVVVDVDTLLPLLIRADKIITWRLLFSCLSEDAQYWRH